MELSEFVKIDDSVRQKLSALRDKTGIGAYALLNGQRAHMPRGLQGFIITQWGTSKNLA